jgi:hypothetical protein
VMVTGLGRRFGERLGGHQQSRSCFEKASANRRRRILGTELRPLAAGGAGAHLFSQNEFFNGRGEVFARYRGGGAEKAGGGLSNGVRPELCG